MDTTMLAASASQRGRPDAGFGRALAAPGNPHDPDGGARRQRCAEQTRQIPVHAQHLLLELGAFGAACQMLGQGRANLTGHCANQQTGFFVGHTAGSSIPSGAGINP
jgi:hypothetical protein